MRAVKRGSDASRLELNVTTISLHFECQTIQISELEQNCMGEKDRDNGFEKHTKVLQKCVIILEGVYEYHISNLRLKHPNLNQNLACITKQNLKMNY